MAFTRETYEDRAAAGRVLAAELRGLDLDDPVVLAMPRGGVPVAAQVAAALGAPLDVVVVRKVGAPGHEEYGIGAVGEGGVTLLDTEAAARIGAGEEQIEEIAAAERDELQRRVERYRGGRPGIDVEDRDVVVVDDGVATGVSARAALEVLRRRGPTRIVFAAPVGSPRGLDDLADVADEVVCPRRPAGFRAVGQYYDDFEQVSDDEVVAALDQARSDGEGVPGQGM